jgi:Rrf2 family iron-sulfur cluster assembly transcriptional regulator
MRLTQQADYAMRAVLYLAGHPYAKIKEIADSQFVPRNYLAKILQKLAAAEIVDTRRGVGGGISLARPAAEITMLDVIEAVEGPVAINRCFIRPGECPREDVCAIHDQLLRVQDAYAGALAGVNFAELARREGS